MSADIEEVIQGFECPWSGDTVEVVIPLRYRAEEFCPTCQFPMFWSHQVRKTVAEKEAAAEAAAEQAAAAAAAEAVSKAVRDAVAIAEAARTRDNARNPSAAATTQPCPSCLESNLVSARFCSYCREPLLPGADSKAIPWITIRNVAAVVLLVALVAVLGVLLSQLM